jgi:predicted GTPase
MILTLHNAIMMKRGRLPVHGAMVKINLKGDKSANIIFMGDTGAGKSESLEAFRKQFKEGK